MLVAGFSASFFAVTRLARHDAELSDERRDFSHSMFLLYEQEKGLSISNRLGLGDFSFSRAQRPAHVPFERYAMIEKKDSGWKLLVSDLANAYAVQNPEKPETASFRVIADGEHEAAPGIYVFNNNLVGLGREEGGGSMSASRLGYLFFLAPGQSVTLGKSLKNQAVFPVAEQARIFEGAPTAFLPGRWLELTADRDGTIRVSFLDRPTVTKGGKASPARLQPRLWPLSLVAGEEDPLLPADKTAVAWVQAVTATEGGGSGEMKGSAFRLKASGGEIREIPLFALKTGKGPDNTTALWVIFNFRQNPLFGAFTAGNDPPVEPLSSTWNNPMRQVTALPGKPCVLAPMSSQFRRFGARQRVSWEKYDSMIDTADHGTVALDQADGEAGSRNRAYAESVIFHPEAGVTIRNNLLFDSRETVAAQTRAPKVGDLAAANRKSYPYLTDPGRDRKIFLDWPARKKRKQPVYLIFHPGPGVFAGDSARLPAPSRSNQGGSYLKDWDALGVWSRYAVCVNGEGRVTPPPSDKRLAGLAVGPDSWAFLGPQSAVVAVSLASAKGGLTGERSGLAIKRAWGDAPVLINGEDLTGESRELRYGDVVSYGEGSWTLASNFGLCLFSEKKALPKNDTTSQMVRWTFSSPVDNGEILNSITGILGDEIFDHSSGRHSRRRTLYPGLAEAPDVRSRLSQGENVRLTLQSDLMEIVTSVTRRHLAMMDADYPYPPCTSVKGRRPCATPSTHGGAVVILNREGKIRACLSLPTFTRESLKGAIFDKTADDTRDFTFRNRALQLTKNDYPGSIFKTVTAMCWLLSPPWRFDTVPPGPLSFDITGPERFFAVKSGDIPIPPYTCTNHLVSYSWGAFWGYEFGPKGIACVGNHGKRRDRVEFLSEILYKSCNQGAMRLYTQYAAPGTLPGSWIEVYKALGFRVLGGSGTQYGPALRFARDLDGEITRILRLDAGLVDVAHLEQYPASLCKMTFGQIVEASLMHLALMGVLYSNGGQMYLPTFREDAVERMESDPQSPLDPEIFAAAARQVGDSLVLGSQRVAEPGRGIFMGTSQPSFVEIQGSEDLGYPVFAGKTSTAEVVQGAPGSEVQKAHTRWMGWQAGSLAKNGADWKFNRSREKLAMAISVENSNNPKAPTHAKFLAAKLAYTIASFFGDCGNQVEKTCASK